MTPLTVELVGIDGSNKGALLMLEAASQALRQHYDDIRIVVSMRLTPELRLRNGLWASLPAEGARSALAIAFRALPAKVRRAGTLVARSEIDVILDASGFAYGDAWPIKKLRSRLLAPLRRRTGSRPKIILLPQAFGPFTSPDIRRDMAEALSKVDLVLARDQASLDHLLGLGVANAPIRVAPDFTNLLAGEPFADKSDRPAYVIPNSKVLTSSAPQAKKAYFDFLAMAVNELRRQGATPSFLIHEGEGDYQIAVTVNSSLDQPAEIIVPSTASEAKQRIASAKCIVSSRYHGLVSALAAGVPALACGWTHKYGALMQDYSLSDLLLNLEQRDEWAAKLDALMRAVGQADRLAALREAAAREKKKSEAMWNAVFEVINAER
jgi:colanic acid/amylovoran biosynthesis protein